MDTFEGERTSTGECSQITQFCANQLETSTPSPHPPSKGLGIWTFEDWIVQFPVPLDQNSVQMPYPIVGFVCQMPLLKNNRQLLSSLVKLVDKHTNMSHAHLNDDAVYKNTTLYWNY